MAHQIIWSDEARENIRDILDYLEENFGEATADRFADRFAEMLERLQQRPFIGKHHPTLSAVREVLIPPHSLLSYAVIGQYINLLNIRDTRSMYR